MGTPEWAPEQTIDPALAARILVAQFPQLADRPVTAFGSGWDNVVLAVGDDWLFRFIHRAVALDGARRELAVLQHLANRFDVPVPHPELVGRPTDEVPWPFWGARPLPGHELPDAALPDAARVRVGATLGGFLRDLHSPGLAAETTAAVGAAGVTLPVDPLRRGHPAAFVPRTRARLEALTSAGRWSPDPRVGDLLQSAAELPPPGGSPVLVHGDLHVRHVLVRDGSVSGVIDWGDTALADPAVDLMVAFAALVGPARDALLTAYGDVPPDRELRARALAVHVSAALLDYAATEGMSALVTESRAALGRAVR